jgi:hypothetical protein
MDSVSQSSEEQTLVIKECASCHRYVGESGELYHPDNDIGDHYIEEKGKKHVCLNVCDGVIVVNTGGIYPDGRLAAFGKGVCVTLVGVASILYLLRRYRK